MARISAGPVAVPKLPVQVPWRANSCEYPTQSPSSSNRPYSINRSWISSLSSSRCRRASSEPDRPEPADPGAALESGLCRDQTTPSANTAPPRQPLTFRKYIPPPPSRPRFACRPQFDYFGPSSIPGTFSRIL